MSDLSLMSITNSFFASAAIFDFSFSFFPQKFAKKNLAQIEIDSLKSILLQNLPNPNLKKNFEPKLENKFWRYMNRNFANHAMDDESIFFPKSLKIKARNERQVTPDRRKFKNDFYEQELFVDVNGILP
jgi:hypothetical protein